MQLYAINMGQPTLVNSSLFPTLSKIVPPPKKKTNWWINRLTIYDLDLKSISGIVLGFNPPVPGTLPTNQKGGM